MFSRDEKANSSGRPQCPVMSCVSIQMSTTKTFKLINGHRIQEIQHIQALSVQQDDVW